jgi:hypothetical protein
MSDTNTNTGNLNPFFHPAAHYASPEDVLSDNELSAPEKRIILSSWASDMFAVESCPALREIPGMGHTIRLADILAALRRLDGDDARNSRSSSPCKPWIPGVPFLARRMWIVAVSRSICSQRMSTNSLTRSACRKAIRISSRSRTGLRLLPPVVNRLSISPP